MRATKVTIIKFIELIIDICLIGLHYYTFGGGMYLLTAGTYFGYLIIIIGLLIGIIMGTPVNRRIDLYFSIVAIILFIIAGVLSIGLSGDYEREAGLAKGVLSIAEGVLFFFDAYFTYRGEA